MSRTNTNNTALWMLVAAMGGALLMTVVSPSTVPAAHAQGNKSALPAGAVPRHAAPADVGSAAAPFTIVDTPGSTYLLNRVSGQVWRLGFTEVRGDRYWFGTHVPVQPPGTFDEFQDSLRRRLDPKAR